MDQTGRFLEELFAENYDRLFRYCMVKLDSDKQAAADCVGDVFLIARNKASLLMQHPDPVGFLYKTAINSCRNHAKYRRRRLRRFVSFETLAERFGFSDGSSCSDPEEAVLRLANCGSGKAPGDAELAKLCEELLGELREEERAVFEMRYSDGLSADEIADRLGISRNAVRMRLFRVADKLKAAAHERFAEKE